MRLLSLALLTLLLTACTSQSTGITPALLGETWVIEDVNAHGIIDSSYIALTFQADGRFSGHASCNPIAGRYQATQQNIRITLEHIGEKACAEALMYQEKSVLDLLTRVSQYQLQDSRTLVLRDENGAFLLARR